MSIQPFCHGSYLVKQFVRDDADKLALDTLLRELQLKTMSSFGTDVPRLVCVQADIQQDGTKPVYRHPADAIPETMPWSETVAWLVQLINERLKTRLNHALIQLYRSSSDNISEHSDKTLDVVPNSLIVNFSIGAQRTMTLRYKDNKTLPGSERQPNVHLALPHNSMVAMSLETNARWTHAIRPDKRRLDEKTQDELAYDVQRLSITLREIGTFLTTDGRIYGTGALGKNKADARPAIQKAEAWESLITAFGKENKSSQVDWQHCYGQGSDAIH